MGLAGSHSAMQTMARAHWTWISATSITTTLRGAWPLRQTARRRRWFPAPRDRSAQRRAAPGIRNSRAMRGSRTTFYRPSHRLLPPVWHQQRVRIGHADEAGLVAPGRTFLMVGPDRRKDSIGRRHDQPGWARVAWSETLAVELSPSVPTAPSVARPKRSSQRPAAVDHHGLAGYELAFVRGEVDG